MLKRVKQASLERKALYSETKAFLAYAVSGAVQRSVDVAHCSGTLAIVEPGQLLRGVGDEITFSEWAAPFGGQHGPGGFLCGGVKNPRK